MRVQTPLELVENAYKAWNEGDFVEMLCAFDPDVHWHSEDGLPYPGDRYGRGEVAEVVRDAISDWSRLDITPVRWTAHGDLVAVVGTYEGETRTTGFRFADRFTHVWKVEGGRGVELRMYRSPGGAMRDLDRRLTLENAEH